MSKIAQTRALRAIERACDKIFLEKKERGLFLNNPNHLNEFEVILKKAMTHIQKNDFNIPVEPYSNMGRYVLDDWPKNTSLGNALLNAEDKIKKYISQKNLMHLKKQ